MSQYESPCSLATPDCPADNQARQLALFLYGTLPTIRTHMKKILLILLVTCALYSCGSLNNNIAQNQQRVERFSEELFDKNGNVFVTGSTNLNSAYLWTYEDNDLKIYTLQNGKLKEERVVSGQNTDWIKNAPIETGMKFSDCYELDGDFFRYKIEIAGQVSSDIIPVDLNCFTNLPKEEEFYASISDIISTYNLKWDWGKSTN